MSSIRTDVTGTENVAEYAGFLENVFHKEMLLFIEWNVLTE